MASVVVTKFIQPDINLFRMVMFAASNFKTKKFVMAQNAMCMCLAMSLTQYHLGLKPLQDLIDQSLGGAGANHTINGTPCAVANVTAGLPRNVSFS